jgi:tryptophan synthase beta chain
MAPLISYLIVKGYMKSFAYRQREVFQAAQIVAQTEGMITAPETAHAWRHVIELALECKRKGEKKVILVNNCGHGLLDLAGYDEFLKGTLPDSEPTAIKYPQYVTEDPFAIREKNTRKS